MQRHTPPPRRSDIAEVEQAGLSDDNVQPEAQQDVEDRRAEDSATNAFPIQGLGGKGRCHPGRA